MKENTCSSSELGLWSDRHLFALFEVQKSKSFLGNTVSGMLFLSGGWEDVGHKAKNILQDS